MKNAAEVRKNGSRSIPDGTSDLAGVLEIEQCRCPHHDHDPLSGIGCLKGRQMSDQRRTGKFYSRLCRRPGEILSFSSDLAASATVADYPHSEDQSQRLLRTRTQGIV